MTNPLFHSIKLTCTLVILIGIGVTGTHAQTPDFVPTEGLVAWYPFDGSAEDVGGNDFDGTPFNVSWGFNRFGEPNTALDLTESFNDYIDLPSAVDSLFSSTITVSCWVNYPAIPGQMIFRNGSTPGLYDTYHAFIANQASTGNMTLRLYTLADEYSSYTYADEETWKHLVLTADSEAVKIYVDGTLVHEDTIWPFDNSPGIFRIGESMYGQPYNYLGHIDDFGIWDRSLTDTEIQGLFTSVAPDFGCTDPEACNYSTLANIDDESCHYPLIPGDCDAGSVACADGTYWNSLIQQCVPTSCPTCPGDGDGDLVIGVSDLLLLLGAFGSDCPETGCTDSQATNYNPNVVINDGSCVYPPCLDAQEPGAACDDGDSNTFNTYWDADGCLCEGSEYVAEDGSGPCEGALTVNYHGYDYQLVEIGEQCWFRENCKFLPTVSPGDVGSEDTPGQPHAYVYGYYGTDVEEAKEFAGRYDTYGVLYNHYAAYQWQLCPVGWHEAMSDDWRNLELALGLPDSLLAAGGGAYGTDIGTQIKSNELWDGTNSSGFTLLGSGYREVSGNFHSLNYSGHYRGFSPSQPIPPNFHGLGTQSGWTGVDREYTFVNKGFAVRCVKSDEEFCFDPDGNGICADNEVFGCTDETACNYNAEATHDDGSCIPSQEAGSSCDDGDDNTFNDAWDAETCTCAGTPAVAEDGSGPCEGALTVNYHGYDYQLVEIGDQCWFRENLRSLEFLNGDSIPSYFTDNFAHGQLAAMSNEGPVVTTYTGDSTYLETIGALYNHRSVSDERGLCPSGWSVPTDSDWAILSINAGMTEAETIGTSWQGNTAGAGIALRASDFFDGANTTGFSAIAAATFSQGGTIYGPASATGFWSASQSGAMAWGRMLGSHPGIQRNYHSIRSGLSVRCILVEPAAISDGGNCDDGLINTYNDTWNAESEQCQGYTAVAEDGSGPCEGQTFVSYHGVEYGLIEIEDQCWFRSNLQSFQFSNGDSIPYYSSTGYAHGVLGALTEAGPAMAGYLADVENISFFGALYNFAVVTDERSICPTGWKVPDDEEWIELTGNLGMPESEHYHVGWKGAQDSVGFQMRTQAFMNGSNVSGFSTKPSGYFSRNGYMYDIGSGTIFWSETGAGSMAWRRGLGNHPGIKREMSFDGDGNSIRCLKALPVVNEPGSACDDGNAETYNDAWDASGSECTGIAGVAADGSGPCSGETAVVYHGVAYPLVEIGDQCWFRENLQTIQFTNGDTIPNLFSGYAHGVLGSLTGAGPAVTAYGAQLGNLSHFGGMYNHTAVVDERGVCPTGWHVPSDDEWVELSAHLGMDEADWYNSNTWSGSSANVGAQLREKSFANGENGSGFSARGSGIFSISGYFYEPGQGGYYWTSSSDVGGAWSRILSSNVPEALRRQQYTPESGMSVRCLMD